MVSGGLLSFNSKFTFNRINLLIFLNRERPFVGIEIKKITSQRKCSLMSKQISLYEKLLVDQKKYSFNFANHFHLVVVDTTRWSSILINF